MAQTGYTGAPTVEPTQQSGNPVRQLNPPHVDADTFGAAGFRALQEAGQGLSAAGKFYGEAAADNAANDYQEGIDKILKGDPTKMVQGPDGKPMPDPGYLGLRGRAAMDARPGVVKQMEELRTQIRGGLKTPDQALHFDNYSRRFKSYADGQVGTHADNQSVQWYTKVNKATDDLQIQHIANNAENEEEVNHATEDLVNSRVKQAQLEGGGPALIEHAEMTGRRDALKARADAIAITDPARAKALLERNKAVAGDRYDNMIASVRPRAEQQIGQETADRMLIEGRVGSVSPDQVFGAVTGHESGGQQFNPDGTVKTSSKGALGFGQVMPGTFAQYALPGEKIENAEDNKAVSKRIIDDLYRKYNGDWKRVAVGYFSGPGNVAPEGSPTPWKQNLNDFDRNGKGNTVEQYVNNVGARLAGVPGGGGIEKPEAQQGRTQPATQAEMLQKVDADPYFKENPIARAAAVSRINQSFAHQLNTETRQRAAFNTRVGNSEAEAMATGTTQQPLPIDDFIAHYGPEEGQTRYDTYTSNVSFGADTKALQTMSDLEQNNLVNQRYAQLKAGSSSYKRDADNLTRLQKHVTEMQKERREDPAGAVAHMPAVADALATYDPKNPESFKLVANARLAAQSRMGIEDEYQSPITKAEALKLTTPFATAIPGLELKALESVAKNFRTMFGEEMGARAMAYALRARKVQGEVAKDAGAVITKLAHGDPLGESERRAFDDRRAEAAEQAAIARQTSRFVPPVPGGPIDTGGDINVPGATTPANPDAPAFDLGGSVNVPEPKARATTTEPTTTGSKPQPNPQAITDLRNNPKLADEFDKHYGTGLAKEILEKYPPLSRGAR